MTAAAVLSPRAAAFERIKVSSSIRFRLLRVSGHMGRRSMISSVGAKPQL